MKTPPHRIAAIALAVLVLGGFGAWWWMRLGGAGHGGNAASSDPAALASVEAGDARPAAAAVADAGGRSKAAENCGKAMSAALRDHAVSLRERNDANSQLAYGLALPFTVYAQMEKVGSAARDAKEFERRIERQRLESRHAFSRAGSLAPDDTEILWVAASHCGTDVACVDMQQALLKAEPDNAAAWLMEMTWARVRNDAAAAERAFERAAAATGYDRHAGAHHLAMLDAFGGVEMPTECLTPGVQAELRRDFPGPGAVDAADFVLVWSMALSQMPAFMDIRQRCKPAAGEPLDRKRRAACGSILEKMAASDTPIEQSVALSLLVQLAGDGPDAGQWRERYRELQWMQSQIMEMAIQRPQTTLVRHQLTMEDYIFDEVRATQAALQAQGRWPPPSDWLPTDETARSLILTGRPPPESRR